MKNNEDKITKDLQDNQRVLAKNQRHLQRQGPLKHPPTPSDEGNISEDLQALKLIPPRSSANYATNANYVEKLKSYDIPGDYYILLLREIFLVRRILALTGDLKIMGYKSLQNVVGLIKNANLALFTQGAY